VKECEVLEVARGGRQSRRKSRRKSKIEWPRGFKKEGKRGLNFEVSAVYVGSRRKRAVNGR